VQVSHSFAAGSAVFDDEHLVSYAGLVPVMTLAEQTGLSRLLGEKVHIAEPRIKSGAANPSPKLLDPAGATQPMPRQPPPSRSGSGSLTAGLGCSFGRHSFPVPARRAPDDAAAAVAAFRSAVHAGMESAITADNPLSLAGAALLSSGWVDDFAALHTPSVVIKT
jgi:hypothetical protein